MTTFAERTIDQPVVEQPVRVRRPGNVVVRWATSTDHKVIGYLYLITSFGFFLLAGVMALFIRAELWEPGTQVVPDAVYNQLFTMHGTIMLLLFATPLFIGFGNIIVPLQIGAPDVAFPRLNMMSYYLFLFGGLIAVAGFLTSRDSRRSAYPRSSVMVSGSVGPPSQAASPATTSPAANMAS